MFGYSIIVAQFFEGKRQPISNGYYCFKQNSVKFTKTKPDGPIFGLKELEEIVYQGFKNLLHNFILSENNIDVYCISLVTNEHGNLLLYINNEAMFLNNNLKYYKNEGGLSLKMNLGDFDVLLSCKDGLDISNKKIMDIFDAINYYINVDKHWYLKDMGDVSINFDSVVFDNAIYYILNKVFDKLNTEISQINKTNDFICYVGCGDDYIDYNINIRKYVSKNLYYTLFPNMKEADDVFDNYVSKISVYSDNKLFSELSKQCINNTHRTKDIFSKTLRNEYEAVKLLETRLSVKKSISFLNRLIKDESRDTLNTKSKIFLLCCVLINHSSNCSVPIFKTSRIVKHLNYQNVDLNKTLKYLEEQK